MPRVVAVPVERLVTMRWAEAQLAEMVLELMQIQWRQMVLPTLAVVAVGQITVLLVVADQELSLSAMHFQLRHLIRQSQLSLARLALVQRCQRQQALGRGRQLRTCTNGSAQQLLQVCTTTSLLQPTTPMLRLNLTLGISSRRP
jgi:hypothetical protein